MSKRFTGSLKQKYRAKSFRSSRDSFLSNALALSILGAKPKRKRSPRKLEPHEVISKLKARKAARAGA